jgi:uncharacterized membrane protein
MVIVMPSQTARLGVFHTAKSQRLGWLDGWFKSYLVLAFLLISFTAVNYL